MPSKDKKSNQGLTKTEVTSTVNLSLNQNDIMDIAIQDELTVVEKQLDVATKELKDTQAKLITARENLIFEIFKAKTGKIKSYKKFQEICEILGIKNPRMTYRIQTSSKRKLGMYHTASFRDYNGKTLQLSTVRRNISETEYNITVPNTLEFTMYAQERAVEAIADEDDNSFEYIEPENNISVTFSAGQIVLDAKDRQQYIDRVKPLNKLELSLLEETFNLEMRVAELEGGEKKIKAHILKTSLGKSEEGRQVLAMLEESKKSRLLLA